MIESGLKIETGMLMSSPKNTFPSAAFGARVFPQDGKSKSQGDKSSLQVVIETTKWGH